MFRGNQLPRLALSGALSLVILLSTIRISHGASLKMSCSSLVIDRIDPLVNPGKTPSPHLHSIVGGSSFGPDMDPRLGDPAEMSNCTTCTFVDDFSNYWTAVMYFRARNGTYKRVRQIGALFHEGARGGGITIYYFGHGPGAEKKVTAFKKGFRMRNGDPNVRDEREALARGYQGIDYTCLVRADTRYTNRSTAFPRNPCPAGILTNIFFPPCWDGVNLDTPDHGSHVAWTDTPNAQLKDDPGRCPASHPVRIPRVLLEIRWDTREFNDPDLWPEDGSQPFVWSYSGSDGLGYGFHGDYIFGWRGDTLAKAFEKDGCGDQICGLTTQEIEFANNCQIQPRVKEEVDGWLDALPGMEMEVDGGSFHSTQ